MDEPQVGPKTLRVPGRLLRAAGEALHGELWQMAVGRLLRVNARTIQRWEQAAKEDRDYQVPIGLLEDLMGALERKAAGLMRAHDALKAFYDDR